MLQQLHKGSLDIARLNYDILTVIPKVKGADNIKQFRPLCMLNVIYKIITRTLAVRLSRVARRFILDGVVVIHEVMHHLRSRKREGIILKLDFEKAYDKVSWKFLKEVLEKKQFDAKWIS